MFPGQSRGLVEARGVVIGGLTDAATDEGEEERGVTGDLGRDLELEETVD